MNSKLQKPVIHIIFYLLGLGLLCLAGKFAPTSLAGPGLDLVVLIIMFLSILYLLIIVWFKLRITLLQKIVISLIHLTVISITVFIINIPQ